MSIIFTNDFSMMPSGYSWLGNWTESQQLISLPFKSPFGIPLLFPWICSMLIEHLGPKFEIDQLQLNPVRIFQNNLYISTSWFSISSWIQQPLWHISLTRKFRNGKPNEHTPHHQPCAFLLETNHISTKQQQSYQKYFVASSAVVELHFLLQTGLVLRTP